MILKNKSWEFQSYSKLIFHKNRENFFFFKKESISDQLLKHILHINFISQFNKPTKQDTVI